MNPEADALRSSFTSTSYGHNISAEQMLDAALATERRLTVGRVKESMKRLWDEENYHDAYGAALNDVTVLLDEVSA